MSNKSIPPDGGDKKTPHLPQKRGQAPVSQWNKPFAQFLRLRKN